MITDKETQVWWNSIVQDMRFEAVKLHARAALLDAVKEPKHIEGAKLYEAIFTTLAEPDPTPERLPGPGLNHDFDSPKNGEKKDSKKPKTKK